MGETQAPTPKKIKKPGRFKLTCEKCQKEFSTHSTNRQRCYQCSPKCIAIHDFKKPVSIINNELNVKITIKKT